MPIRHSIAFLLLTACLVGCSNNSTAPEDDLRVPDPLQPAAGAATADAVLLAWSDIETAFQYRIHVATDREFTRLVAEETTKPYPRIPMRDLERDTEYFWRVRAENGISSSEWSQVRSFRVARTASIPDVPRLTLPAYDQRNMDRRVHLEWEPVEGAYAYHLIVTLDEDMLLYQADLENLDTPYFDLEELVFTYPYWWKVRALGPAGYSDWSSVSLFWVKPAE